LFSFFRINDPYRLIIIFFIVIIISLPFFITGRPLILPELSWMVVGEKMAEGATLYTEIWSNISPLSAMVYWVLDEIFGRSPTAYQIVALLLVMVQSVIFNNTMLVFKAYNENNYIPAFIYSMTMVFHFDFHTLSPVLMGLTMLLYVIHLLFYFIQIREKNDELLLQMGFFLGLAMLFFLPMFLFIMVVIPSLLLFTGISLRRILLFLYGFLLPIVIVGIYYYFKDGTREFLTQYILAFFMYPGDLLVDFRTLMAISAIPIVYLFFAIVKVFRQSGFSNFQIRLQQIMFLTLLVGFLMFLLSKNKAPFQLVVFVPPTAFFIAHYFMLLRKKFWRELLFLLYFFLVFTVNWGSFYNVIPVELINKEALFVQETHWKDMVAGKRILVLGDNITLYKNAQLATPYLEWSLAKIHFHALEYYDNVTAVYKNIMMDTPEIIVDMEGIMPELVSRIPVLNHMYVRESTRTIYRRRN
jgi:hypothetical protein